MDNGFKIYYMIKRNQRDFIIHQQNPYNLHSVEYGANIKTSNSHGDH